MDWKSIFFRVSPKTLKKVGWSNCKIISWLMIKP